MRVDLSDIPNARTEDKPQAMDLSDIPDVTEETKLPTIDLSDIPDARQPHGVSGSFAPSLGEKAIDFISAGHITYDPHKLAPTPEVQRDPETGEEIITPPESAKKGFFEDPITWAVMGAFQGLKYGGSAGAKLLRAAREMFAWGTGGVSEMPAIAKGGAKLATKAATAKPLEKTMAKAVLKEPLGREAVQLVEKEAVAGIPAAGRLAPESEFLQKEFGERYLIAEKERELITKQAKTYKEIIQPEKIAKREFGFNEISGSIPPGTSLTKLKSHPKFKAAKNGNAEAAADLVEDLVKDNHITLAKEKFGEDVIYLPIISIEEAGMNKIPLALSEYYAQKTGAKNAINIYQTNKAFHTGKSAMGRMRTRAIFEGEVIKGGDYVLVDDAITMGGTMAETANYIQRNGGNVKGIICLTNASRGNTLYADPKSVSILKERFGDELEKHFGIKIESLTRPEAKYFLRFKDVKSLRKKSFARRDSESLRLSQEKIQQQKGITPPETTLYGGIPIHKAGEAYTKHIGEPVWDILVMKKIPKLLEKVPGGKAVNRALIYEYRGDLPNTAKYIHSMEDMRRAQSIGREYAIDLGKRLQKVPEKSQLKMGEYITTKEPTVKLSTEELHLAKEAKSAMLDLGKQAVDAGLLAEETFFKNAGRYMPRLYTSKEYTSLLTKFNFKKPTRLDLSRFKMRKDIPKEIRVQMGEILTPGYPIAKGITQLTHDIEMARFFKGIGSNKDWALTKTVLGVESKEGIKLSVPEGWKQLPSNKKLGELSEAYVHPEIFADLQETIRVIETPEKVWRKALGAWKFGKVIVSPKTHVRNLMSNSVLAHLGGLPMYEQPVYLTKAAIAMKEKGKYWQAIRQEGGFEHTFTSGELGALFDQVEGQMAGIKAGGIPEKLGNIGNAWVGTKKGLRKAADLYQAEEQWFKMAKFIHNVERKGMDFKAAWKDAEKWLFNYAKLSRFQEKYRSRWYGAPFATFTFKAMPRIAEAMVKTPWRFALPASIIYGIEKAAQKKIGDTKEEIEAKKELRPEWMKGQILGTPNFARVPIIDEDGREHWLNLTYILPWGDIGEGGKFGPIPGGLVPFSQPFVKEPWQQIANYDSFWKEEIVKEEELAGKTKIEQLKVQAKERGKHLAQAMLPTPVFDISKIIDAFTERPDYRGRFKKPSVVAADVIAGVKMYPVDYSEQVIRQISKLDPQKGYLAKKIYAQIRTYAIKKKALEKRGAKTEFYDKKIKEKIKQLQGLAEQTGEVGELYKKISK